MESLLVPGKCFFYVSSESEAPPFDPALGATGVAPEGWVPLGNTSREDAFSIEQIDPSGRELEFFDIDSSFCRNVKYWRFHIPVIDFNAKTWELLFPGGERFDDTNGYGLGDGEPVRKSFTAVFLDNSECSGIYFNSVKLLHTGGFDIGLNQETRIELSGLVLEPEIYKTRRFVIFEKRGA